MDLSEKTRKLTAKRKMDARLQATRDAFLTRWQSQDNPDRFFGQDFFMPTGLRFRQNDRCPQQLSNCPEPISQTGSHSRGSGTIASFQARHRGSQ
jgi:hypothetical protein